MKIDFMLRESNLKATSLTYNIGNMFIFGCGGKYFCFCFGRNFQFVSSFPHESHRLPIVKVPLAFVMYSN